MSQSAMRLLVSPVARRLASVTRMSLVQRQSHPVLRGAAVPVQMSRLDFSSSTGGPRRRKRGSSVPPPPPSDSDDASAEDSNAARARAGRSSKSKVTDPERFAAESTKLLKKIEEAVRPMEQINDVFVISTTPSSLTIELAPHDGMYSLEVDEAQKCIYFQSAVSGRFTYFLNAKSNEWVSSEDGHIFEGMLVRDLIRQCKGVPKL